MLRLADRLSRRTFGQILAAGSLVRQHPAGASVSSLTPLPQSDPAGAIGRRYRADAQVLLLSVPVLKRRDVGDGSVVWRDSVAPDGAPERFLEFMARSTPEHAAGLNRFGFIQELSRHGGSVHAESVYFGLMTASTEENAGDARKALHSEAKEAWFSAIEGRLSASSIDTVSARFLAPARTSSDDRHHLIARARAALSGATARKEGTRPGGPPPQPFLHVLANLLRSSEATDASYVYNGRLYRVRVERSIDSKAAKSFGALGLVAAGDRVLRIAGSLWREGESSRTDFKLWIREGEDRPIPLRFEYQPKAYLRLVFEAHAAA